MRAIVVLYVWIRMRQGDVASFVLNVIAKMTGNKYYPTPDVKLEDLDAAAALYAETFGNRLNGKNARAEFRTAKDSLFGMLKDQAGYINGVIKEVTDPNVRDEMITSAGMVSTKSNRSKKTTPEQPKAPEVSYKNGDLLISVPTVNGASNYLWMIFYGEPFPVSITGQQLEMKPSINYIMLPAGTSRECVRNVPVGTDVYVQVLAQNTAGKSAFSPAVAFHTGG